MKKFILILSLTVAIGTVITLNSCKKTETPSTTDDSVSAQDVASISNGINATGDDASAAAGQVSSFAGKSPDQNTAKSLDSHLLSLCGTTIVDTGTAGDHLITITYDGTTMCNGVIRSGVVTIANNSGIPWKDAGSVITVTYNNLKITDAVSLASYTVNGSHTFTKETAGLEYQVMLGLATNTTVVRRNQGSMEITFPNGETRTWTVDRTRSWGSVVTGNLNTITVSVYSEASGNVDVTGTNRYGTDFTNTINTAIEANNNTGCIYKPYQGSVTHAIANRTVTVLYGTNPAGVSIGTPTTCGDGFFITYTKNGNLRATRFVYYW